MTKETQLEEGMENFPKPHATAVDPLVGVDLEPEQKVTPPQGKEKAKRPADNDNPEGVIHVKDSVEINDAEEAKIVQEQEAPKFELSEDISGLLESIEFPSEFKEKALTIFEAAVTGQVADLHKTMLEHNAVAMETYKTSLAERLEEQVNTYMTDSVAKWLEENQLAVKSNLRTQIAESFMANLVSLLESHYISVPEGKEDILESTMEKVETLETSLAEAVESNRLALEENVKLQKELTINEAVASLTDTQKERVKTLAESIKDADIAVYKEKLNTIIESLDNKVEASKFVVEDAVGEVEVQNKQVVQEAVSEYAYIANLAEELKRFNQ